MKSTQHNTTLLTPNEYLPTNFKITVWSKLKPYFNELLLRPLEDMNDYEKWTKDKREIERLVIRERDARKLGEPALAEYFEFQIQPKIEFFLAELEKRRATFKF